MANCSFSEWPPDEAVCSNCQAEVTQNLAHLVIPQAPCSEEDHQLNFNGYPQWAIPHEGLAEDRAATASRSHSEAEKRRRDRINGQLATLRKLIPKSEKLDKAGLLGRAVEHVKDLKTKAKEVSKVTTIPSDIDEVIIDFLNKDQQYSTSSTTSNIKVSFCCDDRPELFSEINRALQGLNLTVAQAEMTSLAGRIKGIFVLCAIDNTMEEKICMDSLKKSLKVVLSRIVIAPCTLNYRVKSKRQRFFLPSD